MKRFISALAVMFLLAVAVGSYAQTPTSTTTENLFVGTWEIKSVDILEKDVNLTGKAEVMSDHTFKAYWIQSSLLGNSRDDFSGRWTLDEKTHMLRLEFVASSGISGRKDSGTASLKYEFANATNAGSESLVLSKSGMDIFAEQAKLEGKSDEELKKEIDSWSQYEREESERQLIKIVLQKN